MSQKRQDCYRNLAKLFQTTCELLDVETDLSALESLRDALDKSKEELNQAHRTFHNTLESEQERLESYQWFDIRDREFMEFRLRLIERIQSLERIHSQESQASSVKSGKSRRSESVCSSRSARSLRLEAAAKSARLRAEIDFLDQERELRRLQLLKEVSIAEAEERAMKRIIDGEQPPKITCEMGSPFVEGEHTKGTIKFGYQSGVHDSHLEAPMSQQHVISTSLTNKPV